MPFEIPESWVWTTLGNIGQWQSGATPSRLCKEYYGGTIPWLKTGDLNDGYIYDIPEYITEKALAETSVKLNPVGSILIAMYGATIGKVGILTFPATTNQACCACEDYSGIEQKYLFYFLLSHKEEFIRQGGGGAQPNISKEKIVETLIPLPPRSEQIRIVKAIEKWFSIIDQLEQEQTDLKNTIKRVKSKILDLAIHGKLVPRDPNDEPAIDLLQRINPNFKPCDNAHYPSGWVQCSLNDIFNLTMGQSPTGDSINNTEGIEFHQGKIFFTDIYISKSNIYTSNPTKIAERESLLLCVRAPVGIVNISNRDICIGRGLCALQPKGGNLRFYFYLLKTMQDEFEQQATGSTFKAISGNIIKNTKIVLPPKHEQNRIVKRIEELFVILDKIKESLEAEH